MSDRDHCGDDDCPVCSSAGDGCCEDSDCHEEINRLKAINAELLEACQETYRFLTSVEYSNDKSKCLQQVTAAITRANGE